VNLSERQQKKLVGELVVEIELALVFARIAIDRIQRGDDKRSRRALGLARTELSTIHQCEDAIADLGVRQRIHDITDELNHVLTTLSEAEMPMTFECSPRTH
jgi:hypothetical protein